MKNSSSKFAILTLIIVSICVGLIIFFSTQFTVTVTPNQVTKTEDTFILESIKNVEEAKVTDFNSEIANQIANEYIQAVNEKNWAVVEKYSKGMAQSLSNYGISDMRFVKTTSGKDFDYIQDKDEYVFLVEFTFTTQNNEEINKIANGKYFTIKTVDGIVKVNPISSEL